MITGRLKELSEEYEQLSNEIFRKLKMVIVEVRKNQKLHLSYNYDYDIKNVTVHDEFLHWIIGMGVVRITIPRYIMDMNNDVEFTFAMMAAVHSKEICWGYTR